MTWLFICLLNTWSGAHFVGERSAERMNVAIVPIIRNFSTIVDYGVNVVPSKNARKAREDVYPTASEAEKDLSYRMEKSVQHAKSVEKSTFKEG